MTQPPFRIGPARTVADFETAARLFERYAASLGIDLAYQGFAEELATLPGSYAPPAGALLLAHCIDGEPLGCVALRPMAPADCPVGGCCEMKRLYVLPRGRGIGLGRALVDAILAEAVRVGYREMRLDTLPTLTEAIALYRKAGFTPIAAYYDTPVPGTIFLGRSLAG
ncbi:GNAT family N-acetyltransferase (plasmid) [Skermanella sp. TT6]|uniref:GNAT family N-acetyltransferase n=1 Tax=Skermanella cutis TaxID=2775420 RepID=A0ABX7BF13_9PROT|nr:GNAT family N-acetyltransferase [Skermanella sp. TT6]QQP92984.1 GNAT family N-acetyltransferase [Skermanella sp. TT6]